MIPSSCADQRRRRWAGDGGQVGGIEALPFGVLLFIVGSLIVANAWAVIDAKFATDAAAREAVRSFVEADPAEADPTGAARTAGLAALEGHGRDPARGRVGPVGEAALVRCQRIVFEAVYEVPAITVPLVGRFGRAPFTVRSTSSELVDPYRDGLSGEVGSCG
jgi:hypothetical protein